MKGRERVIDSRHPLGHSHIIGVFSFEEELEVPVAENAIQPGYATISSYSCQSGISIADELDSCLRVYCEHVRPWGPVHSLDEIIVEIGRANTYLRLFQAEHAIVVPRRLPKCHERNWMYLTIRSVGLYSRGNLVSQRFK